MVAALVLAVLLVVMALGYEYWIATNSGLPFEYESFTEFGYIVHNYMPWLEKFLANTFSVHDQVNYISPLFKTPTILVVVSISVLIIVLTVLSKLIEWKKNGGELFGGMLGGIFGGRSKYARHKEKSKGRIKYKRKR